MSLYTSGQISPALGCKSFQIHISVAHRWMVLSCTHLIQFGWIIRLNDILSELVPYMNTYPRTVEVFSFMSWQRLHVITHKSNCLPLADPLNMTFFPIGNTLLLNVRCSWKFISCLWQDNKTSAGLSTISGVKQSTMGSILCMHLFCRWLEIKLPNRLMSTSIKCSGQTVFSIYEIEFRWGGGGKKQSFGVFLNCRNKIIYNFILNCYLRTLFPIMLCQKVGCTVTWISNLIWWKPISPLPTFDQFSTGGGKAGLLW